MGTTVLAEIDPGLRQRVEETILEHGSCGLPWLDTGLRPLLTRPGKRLRPALVFAAAACGPAPGEQDMVACAASVELMHLSSLVHDDLMDGAISRGGRPTLHFTHGRDAALLGGDHLVAAGGQLAAQVSADAARAWQQGYRDLCAGQIRETANRHRSGQHLDEYLASVRGKTGALMRASCLLGAQCAGLDDAQVAALGRFGDAFGMVFQLVDDLMDVLSTEQLWTKPVQLDVPNGIYTAAVLSALGAPGSALRNLLGRAMSGVDVERAYEHARADGVAAALDLLERYIAGAERALAPLPDSPARTRLAAMPRGYAFWAISTKVAPEHARWVRLPSGV